MSETVWVHANLIAILWFAEARVMARKRRYIHNALQAGATMEEIMEVLKLCVVQGVQACNLAVPILAEELANQNR